jgi:hypothetical protein
MAKRRFHCRLTTKNTHLVRPPGARDLGRAVGLPLVDPLLGQAVRRLDKNLEREHDQHDHAAIAHLDRALQARLVDDWGGVRGG